MYSRLLAERVLDPKTGEVLAEYNDVITQELARKIADCRRDRSESPLADDLRTHAWHLLQVLRHRPGPRCHGGTWFCSRYRGRPVHR